MFNLVQGPALLLASAVAGIRWEAIGPTATFPCGGAFAVLALVPLLARGAKA